MEYDNELNVKFVDHEIVFDRLDSNIIWETIEKCGINW